MKIFMLALILISTQSRAVPADYIDFKMFQQITEETNGLNFHSIEEFEQLWESNDPTLTTLKRDLFTFISTSDTDNLELYTGENDAPKKFRANFIIQQLLMEMAFTSVFHSADPGLCKIAAKSLSFIRMFDGFEQGWLDPYSTILVLKIFAEANLEANDPTGTRNCSGKSDYLGARWWQAWNMLKPMNKLYPERDSRWDYVLFGHSLTRNYYYDGGIRIAAAFDGSKYGNVIPEKTGVFKNGQSIMTFQQLSDSYAKHWKEIIK